MATSSSLATHLFPLKWELDVCVAPQAYSTVGSNTQKDLQIHRFQLNMSATLQRYRRRLYSASHIILFDQMDDKVVRQQFKVLENPRRQPLKKDGL